MDDRGHSGFTLVELLVTLAIAAILSGVAVPAMTRHLDRTRLHAASDALVQELQQARNHAINYRKTVYFSLATDTPDWCFGWSDRAPCDCSSDVSRAACRSGENASLRYHSQRARDFAKVGLNSSRSGSSHTLQFSPLRGAATAASFYLRSLYAGQKVIVSPLGRVRSCATAGPDDPAC